MPGHNSHKTMRRRYFFIVFPLLIAILSACGGQSSSSNGGNSSTTPIKIGYSVPITGDFSGDGPLLQEGYRLWAKMVNSQGGLLGRQVQLIGKNDASNPTQVTTDYTNLISQDHADLLLAPIAEDLTLPAAVVARRYGKILVEGASTEQDVYKHGLNNLFAVSLPAEKYISSFANFILSLPQKIRPTTAAYVTRDDFFSTPQVAEARMLLENNGNGLKTVLPTVTFGAETTNFNTIAAQVVQSNAQVVVFGTEDITSTAAFIKYFRSHHYNPQALVFSSGPDGGSTFLQAIGNGNNKDTAFQNQMAEGIFVPNDGWFTNIKTYQNDTFQQLWQQANPDESVNTISSDDVQAFSSAQVLQQAVEATHSLDNAVLQTYLHARHTFNSIQGAVEFDPEGRNVVSIPFLFQWQDGHYLPVYPSNSAQVNPEFPKKAWP